MVTLNVQFADSTEQAVVAYFACPQDATAYPNQGQVPSSDARYETFFNAQPESMQKGLPSPD